MSKKTDVFGFAVSELTGNIYISKNGKKLSFISDSAIAELVAAWFETKYKTEQTRCMPQHGKTIWIFRYRKHP